MGKTKKEQKCKTVIEFREDDDLRVELQFHHFKSIDKDHEVCTKCGIKTVGLCKYVERHKLNFDNEVKN